MAFSHVLRLSDSTTITSIGTPSFNQYFGNQRRFSHLACSPWQVTSGHQDVLDLTDPINSGRLEYAIDACDRSGASRGGTRRAQDATQYDGNVGVFE
jgi:hypothetical protein